MFSELEVKETGMLHQWNWGGVAREGLQEVRNLECHVVGYFTLGFLRGPLPSSEINLIRRGLTLILNVRP